MNRKPRHIGTLNPAQVADALDRGLGLAIVRFPGGIDGARRSHLYVFGQSEGATMCGVRALSTDIVPIVNFRPDDEVTCDDCRAALAARVLEVTET